MCKLLYERVKLGVIPVVVLFCWLKLVYSLLFHPQGEYPHSRQFLPLHKTKITSLTGVRFSYYTKRAEIRTKVGEKMGKSVREQKKYASDAHSPESGDALNYETNITFGDFRDTFCVISVIVLSFLFTRACINILHTSKIYYKLFF